MNCPRCAEDGVSFAMEVVSASAYLKRTQAWVAVDGVWELRELPVAITYRCPLGHQLITDDAAPRWRGRKTA